MFNIVMTYLSEDDEVRVVDGDDVDVDGRRRRACWTAPTSCEFQHLVRQVLVAEDVARYAVRLVDASRPGGKAARRNDFVDTWVSWGAGLRASQALILGGKARALMQGRYHVSVADMRALAPPILRHRIITNFYAESEHVDADVHRRPAARRGAGAARAVSKRETATRAPPGERVPRPAVIARLATLELRARTIVEGFLSGLHRSPLKGFSVEFAEYRQYLPGDDLSTIDWKVFARDGPLLRQEARGGDEPQGLSAARRQRAR